MRPSTAVALVIIAVCLAVCAFIVIGAVVRIVALRRRAQALSAHPTMLALRQSDALSARLHDLPVRVQLIRSRVPVIARNVSQIVEASWVVRMNVRLLELATERMLHSLLP